MHARRCPGTTARLPRHPHPDRPPPGGVGRRALGLGGVALLVALACYNPLDPSFNTATSLPPTNLAGPAGAIAADLLLQSFGLAAVLPSLAMLAWAWRIASHRGLGSFAARLASTLAALPAAASVAAAIPGQWTVADRGRTRGRHRQRARACGDGLRRGSDRPVRLDRGVAHGPAGVRLLIWASLGLSVRRRVDARRARARVSHGPGVQRGWHGGDEARAHAAASGRARGPVPPPAPARA